MLYLYLDESGDLGFDFVNKNPSRFFVVSIMAVRGDNARLAISNGIKRVLRKKINPKNKRKRFVEEIKGSASTFEVKKYFFKQVEDIDFSIYSIIFNKKRVYDSLIKDKSRVYNWVARLLLDNVDLAAANNRVVFIIDKSKGKREIEEFNEYIYRHLEAKINPGIPLDIRHLDSRNDYGLQAVDLFVWGVFRKYERKDLQWWSVFKEKVKFENVYLPENKK